MGDWKKQLGSVKRKLEAREETRRVLEKEQQERGGLPRGSQKSPPVSAAAAASRPGAAKASPVWPLGAKPGGRAAYEYPAVREPLPKEPPHGSQVFNVGVDFGTSKSKVCVRQALGEGEDIPIVPLTLETSPLCPSLVGIAGGRVYFGEEAERRRSSGAILLPYLKACLACEVERKTPPLAACGLTRGAEPRCHGEFLYGNGRSRRIWASDAATLYLAWVMGQARRVMPRSLVGRTQVGFTYNLGVPLDQLDRDSSLLRKYLEIAFRAWRLSEGITQGLPIEKALGWLGALRGMPIPRPETNYVQLCGETGAAIVSCALSPNMPSGLYGLVDVGAWTTDISFFRLTDPFRSVHGRHELAFYGARTHRIAVNDLDGRSMQGIRDLWELKEDAAQLASMAISPTVLCDQREQGTFGEVEFMVKNFRKRPARPVLDYARACVAERLLTRFHTTLLEASEKEKQAEIWRGFLVYVMGGGVHEPSLWEDWAARTPVVGTLEPLPFGSLELDLDEALSWRFPVAVGLAYPLGMWPKVLLPSQVAPVGPFFPTRELPTSEQLGYDEK